MGLSPVMREAIRAAAQAGNDAAQASVPATRPGVVVSVAPTNTVAMVMVDGPEGGPFGADVIAPVVLQPGDRVMLLFAPPHGCMIIGLWSGAWDDWHIVGDEGEPQYTSAWQVAAGTVALGQNGYAPAMFTRRGDRVELRGRAERVTPSAGTDNVFVLPEGYWPDNDLFLRCSGSLGGSQFLIIDQATGTLTCADDNIVILDGVSYLARIQQPD